MRIVIAGAGTLGRRVARYTRDQHEVLVIEQSRTRGRAVEEELGVKVLVGDADEPEVLLEAGVDRADVFVASTGHDEDNLVACLLALTAFEPHVRWMDSNSFWEVVLSPDVPNSLRVSVALVVALAVAALWRLVRPGRTAWAQLPSRARPGQGTPPRLKHHGADGPATRKAIAGA